MTPTENYRRLAHASLRAVAALYLVGLWLDAVGCSVPARVLPHALDYFMEVAALFPEAAGGAIDYRAEGWTCTDARWEEIDTRPYFPLDPEDKENRFQRALNFYRDDAQVHRALETYLVDRHNAGPADDGIPRDQHIGGVRLVRVRVPIPAPGATLERFTRRPLADIPKSEKETLYRTPKARIEERCGTPEGPTPGPE
jgi:hypothetical protein